MRLRDVPGSVGADGEERWLVEARRDVDEPVRVDPQLPSDAVWGNTGVIASLVSSAHASDRHRSTATAEAVRERALQPAADE